MKCGTPFVVAATLQVTGCTVAVSEPQDFDEIGEVGAELSIAGGVIWGTPGNNGEALMLGNTSQETCFLSGVSGSLVGRPGYSLPTGGYVWPLPALAEVYPQNGKWWVKTRAGIGQGVLAHVICINKPYSGVELTFSRVGNQGSSNVIDFDLNQHCFFRKIETTGALTMGDHHLSISHVLAPGVGWHIGGFVASSATTQVTRAAAVCVRFDATSGWSFRLRGPTNADNSATNTIYLRDFYPNGPLVPTSDVACGLTMIKGRWISDSPDPLGWDNGVYLRNSTQYWRMTASNGRTGEADCYR